MKRKLSGEKLKNVLTVLLPVILCIAVIKIYSSFIPALHEKNQPQLQSAWPTFHQNFQRTGRTTLKGPDGPDILWRFDTGSPVNSSPVVGPDGSVLIAGQDNVFRCLDSRGKERWRIPLSNRSAFAATFAFDNLVLITGYQESILAVDFSDGVKRWGFQAERGPLSCPAVDEDSSVIFGSEDNHLYRLDNKGKLIWKYRTNGFISSAPAIGGNGEILFGSEDGFFYSVGRNGLLGWRFKTGGEITGSLAIDEDGFSYGGSLDHFIYSFDQKGRLRWKMKTGHGVTSSPALTADGGVAVPSEDGVIYCLNRHDGRIRWSHKTGGAVMSSPAVDGEGRIYAGSKDGKIYCIEGSTGKLLFTVKTERKIVSSPAVGQGGVLFIGSDDGHVYAVGSGKSR